MAYDDVQIQVINRQTPLVHNSVNYQPFGVKILKLRVRRNPATKPDLDPIWIHPLEYQPPEHQSADSARWRSYGTADGDDALWVAWGAGDEHGFAVKTTDRFGFNKKAAPLDDDDFHYVYLHLIHRPDNPRLHKPAPKTLTVQATDSNGIVRGQETIQLTVPTGADNSLRAIWETDWSNERSTIKLASANDGTTSIPRYVSRWWPSGQVTYEPIDDKIKQFLAEFTIIFLRKEQNKNSGRIVARLGQEDLLRIGGDIAVPIHDYRLFNVELFRFLDDRHVVIRLWLYWVQLRFSADQLLTFVPPALHLEREEAAGEVADGLDAWWQGGAGGIIRFLPWRIKEEVPDVERFDLLIDPEDTSIKFVGTDTHWQEFWAESHELDEPIEAKIAPLSSSTEVFLQSLDVPRMKTPPIFNPLANGLCDYVNDSHLVCPHRKGDGQMVPVDKLDPEIDYRVCAQCGTHFIGQGVKAVGFAKHAPVLANVDVIEGTVSSSVLDG